MTIHEFTSPEVDYIAPRAHEHETEVIVEHAQQMAGSAVLEQEAKAIPFLARNVQVLRESQAA